MASDKETCNGTWLPVPQPVYISDTIPNPFAPGYKAPLPTTKNTEQEIPIDPHTRSIQEFNGLFTSIRQFNAHFSQTNMIHSLFEWPQASPISHLSKDSQDEQAGRIRKGFATILLRTGLSLENVPGNGIATSQEDVVTQGQLRINVSDREKFVGFLQEIDPQETQNNTLGTNLQTLGSVLAQQIVDHYDLKNPGREELELLGSLRLVAVEYNRLGLTNALGIYLKHAQKGDLREYLQVMPFMIEPDAYASFGPVNWHTDSSKEELTERWEKACQALDAAKKNPKALDLYEKLYDLLQRSIQIAVSDLEKTITQNTDDNTAHLTSLQSVLNRVERILDSYETGEDQGSK